jgi:hypothetical protein
LLSNLDDRKSPIYGLPIALKSGSMEFRAKVSGIAAAHGHFDKRINDSIPLDDIGNTIISIIGESLIVKFLYYAYKAMDYMLECPI